MIRGGQSFMALTVLLVSACTGSSRVQATQAFTNFAFDLPAAPPVSVPTPNEWRLQVDRVYPLIRVFAGDYDVRSDGVVAMKNGINGDIHIFQPWDGPSRTIGWSLPRVGPTEVLGPRLLPDGSLVLMTKRGGEVFVLDSTGAVKRSWQRTDLWESDHVLAGFWVDRSHRLVVLRNRRIDATAGEVLVYPSVDSGGPPTITQLPDRDPPPAIARASVSRNGLTITNLLPIPTHPTVSVTVGSSGEVFWTQGDPYMVQRRLDSGIDTVVARREQPSAPLSEDERTQYTDYIIARQRVTDTSWRWNGPVVRDVHPAIEGLSVDDQGRLWVTVPLPSIHYPEASRAQGTLPGNLSTQWARQRAFDVFDASGQFLARIPVQPGQQSSLVRVVGQFLYLPRQDQSQGFVELVRYRIVTGSQ